MYGSADNEEQASLLPERERNKNTNTNNDGAILVNRIILLLTLVALVCVSVYCQSQVTTLKLELQEEEKQVHDLVKTVKGHAQVIQRFNQSVTNRDVLTRLQLLDKQLNLTTADLQHAMHKLHSQVTDQLRETMTELGETVQEAKDEISREVVQVKKDVDQYVITTQDQFSMENSFMVFQLAGTLTLLSCLISMWHMTAHLRKMEEPFVQRKILAILWMSPIYAVTSWFSLVFHSAEGYLAIIKDTYEAYVIYQFLSFCIAVLGKGDRNKVVDILAKRADHLTPPFQCCWCCNRDDPYKDNPRALADAILLQCQIFGLQFVLLRPLTTIATVVMAQLQYYGGGDGPNDYRAPQFYIAIVQNVSVFVAFTGLLKFYHAVDEDLAWCRPFAKFLCIKGVVFLTFWQGLAITILAETTDVGGQKSDEWAKSAQNFLICLEMLLFSIAHFYCFPTEEWNPDYRARATRGFTESLALGDFLQDVKLILKSGKRKKSKKPSEPTVPEGDEKGEDDETVNTTTSIASSSAEVETALREQLIGGDDNDEEEDENVTDAKKRLSLLARLSFLEDGDSGGPLIDSPSGKGVPDDETDERKMPAAEATETQSLLAENEHKDESSSDEEEGIPPTKNEEILQPSIFTAMGAGRSK